MRQYCIYVQIRKYWSQRLGIAIPKLVPQRMASSESTQFQAKLKKIGAVVTRAGTYNRNPIVAILGWNSAQDKHLAKYSEIFENKGFDTIRLSANPFNTFILLSRVKDVSLKLLNILIEMKSDPNQPVILYSLSMGGFNVYYFIHQAISTPGQKYFKSINIVGCIFDSCPHFPGAHSLKGVRSTILETIPNPLLKGLMWVGLGIVVPPAFHFGPYIKRLISDSIHSPMGCPELYLYSNVDHLVPEKNVETFIEAHKNKGVEVFSRLWEGSGHVQHYKNYPEEYLKEVNTFTDYCLRKYALKSRL